MALTFSDVISNLSIRKSNTNTYNISGDDNVAIFLERLDSEPDESLFGKMMEIIDNEDELVSYLCCLLAGRFVRSSINSLQFC